MDIETQFSSTDLDSSFGDDDPIEKCPLMVSGLLDRLEVLAGDDDVDGLVRVLIGLLWGLQLALLCGL